MAHDYKHAFKTSSSTSGAPPGWLWFVAGLTVGLFVAVLTYLGTQYSQSQDGAGQRAAVERKAHVAAGEKPPGLSGRSSGPNKSTGATKKNPALEFEFYTILPEREIRVPEHELRAREPAPRKAETPAPDTAASSYILQVGSFRHLVDADQLKAELVLNGFDVEIQTVSTNNDTWYRVRLGPYRDLDVMHAIRADLQKSGFAPLVLKEKRG